MLVISKNEYNKHTNDMVVVAITSNLEDKEFGVLIKKEDLTEGELKVDSQIRADKIYTLSQDIIIKRFGRVNDNTIEKVKNRIGKLID